MRSQQNKVQDFHVMYMLVILRKKNSNLIHRCEYCILKTTCPAQLMEGMVFIHLSNRHLFSVFYIPDMTLYSEKLYMCVYYMYTHI